MNIIQEYLNKINEYIKGTQDICSQLVRYIDCMRIFYRYYTSHDILHSLHLLKRILEFDNLFALHFNKEELVILYLASFLHDIGMLPTKNDLANIRNNRQSPADLAEIIKEIRNTHGNKKRIAEYLEPFTSLCNFMFSSPTEIIKFREILLDICSVHTEKSDRSLDDLNTIDNFNFGKSFRTRLLGIVIRLADEFDCGRDRAIPEIFYDFNIIPDDQQDEHIKHLFVENIRLEKNNNKIEIIINTGNNITANIQVLKNILEFFEKVNEELNRFIHVLKNDYGYDPIANLRLSSNNEKEIFELVRSFNSIINLALYSDKNFMVIEDNDETIKKLFEIKKIYISKFIKYLIVLPEDSGNIEWYRKQGVNQLFISSDEINNIRGIDLNKDLAVSISCSKSALHILTQNYYPDMYILDIRDIHEAFGEDSKAIIRSLANLIYNFCTTSNSPITNRTIEGRIKPFIVFIDNEEQRLRGDSKFYLEIIDSINRELHGWYNIQF